MIVAISVGTICIGGIAYTIANHNIGNSGNKKAQANVSVTDDSFSSGTYSTESGDMVLEKNAYPEVNELVKEYFNARVACDMDKLGTLVSDITYINEEDLQKLGTYVEAYQNIDCYTVATEDKKGFVVLAYTDIKLKDIKTPAPGLTGLYVSKDDKDNYVIFNGMLSDDQQIYRESVYACKGVQDLIDSVQAKYKEALASDKDLNAFYAEANKEKEENEIPEATEDPEATTDPEAAK